MFSPKSSLQPYYNFKFWPVTYQNINEYSKIKDIPRINDHIKHNEKLLLLDFTVLKDIEWSGERYINHKLQIIRTAKDGILICGNKSYPHLNLQKIEEPLGGVYSHLYSNYYTVPSGHMINSTLRALFDYHNPSRHSRCAKYTVRLFEDDLLDEIRTKQKTFPSLLHLCISAISTNDLRQYNNINRTMDLSLKNYT